MSEEKKIIEIFRIETMMQRIFEWRKELPIKNNVRIHQALLECDIALSRLQVELMAVELQKLKEVKNV